MFLDASGIEEHAASIGSPASGISVQYWAEYPCSGTAFSSLISYWTDQMVAFWHSRAFWYSNINILLPSVPSYI